MARYIKKFARIGHSLGPSEERGFELWVGYDIAGVEADLSYAGLIRVDDWPDDKLAERGVATFTVVQPDDAEMYEKLEIERER